ncbi:dyslexia-associated protein KIAA0319-like protein [Caerostris extrusa]|uniref:Dyslexia-associated protein KIAA0319-like protein n=1 Tax=Caerostris extrusa TaxID=172846 RepID=A0AAV4MPB4_CAEEX|nr:dyslexia-associated protein KIAA0319-like protein [Caerostris extrusa]
MKTISFLILGSVIVQLSSAFTDSACIDFSTDYIFPQSTPYGNLTAGIYKKISDAVTFSDCIQACCDDDNCNVAFLYKSVCFTLHCRSRKLCEPLKRKGKKHQNSLMVIVRKPGEKYIYGNEFGDDENEKLFQDDYTDFANDEELKETGPSLFETSPTDFFTAPPKSCLYGVEMNVFNMKNVLQKILVLVLEFVIALMVMNVTGMEFAKKGALTKNVTEKLKSTTSSPVQLVVSAGDNVTLHLPENEVTLSAYALKQPEGESENYEWTLISHPEGDETGTMQDQNTKNLKLSSSVLFLFFQLRAGVYTFKVTVTSGNAFGEAMVNVTVLPPEGENKPPVAVIQPSNVTVKLPNTDTVLDGSFSTDDDKIVRYQWEVLEVPIGYSVQLNETPTLQLKNLILVFIALS